MEEKLIEVTDCIRPCDTVIYECTVVGGGYTVWEGDFFHCSSGSKDIILHHQLTQGEFQTRTCNNGSIVGQIVRAEDGVFTSQLSVILTPSIAGKSINCTLDNGTLHTIGSLNLNMG